MKKSLIASTIGLTLLLTACGDDDFDEIRNNIVELDQSKETWAEYYYSGESETENSLTKYLILRDGKVVYHFEHSEYSAYKEDDNHESNESSYIYLTNNELIDPHVTYNNQHALAFEVLSHTDEKWVTSLLNQNKKSNLQFTDEYKIIDVSGQRLSDHISQTLMLLSKDKNYLATASEESKNRINGYLKQFDDHVFPQGSKCRIYGKSYVNQDYVMYYTLALTPNEFKDVQTYFNVDQNVDQDGYTQTQLSNNPVYFYNANYIDTLGHWAVINKDNNWYDGTYYRSGLTADPDLYLQEYQKLIDSETLELGADAEDVKYLKTYHQVIPTQCDHFNDVASAKIDAVQKIKS